jgi:hypothetical protein
MTSASPNEKSALPDAIGQRRSLHQFHHQVVRADVVEMTDVGMIQRGDGVHFAREAIPEALGGNLDCDEEASIITEPVRVTLKK